MNKIITKRMSEKDIKGIQPIFDYTDYFINLGAKRIDINTKNGFSITTDVVLNEEQINSKEFQKLVVNLYNCLTA